MSNLSELLPSGGGQNQVEFVASGTLPNGKPVILKSNGQVEVVGISSTSVSQSIPLATEVVFDTGHTTDYGISFDPNTTGKFVIVYQDSGDGNNDQCEHRGQIYHNAKIRLSPWKSKNHDPRTATKFGQHQSICDIQRRHPGVQKHYMGVTNDS